MFNLFIHPQARQWAYLVFGLSVVTWLVYSGQAAPPAAKASIPHPTQLETASTAPKQIMGDPAALPQAQPAHRPASQGEAEWTVMLYQDADDETLEQDIMIDFNEAERVGSTDQVNIVAQVDRYDGGFDGMGDWTSAKRFYVTQDDDLNEIGSEELEDLGEVNMADGQTLVDFIVWAIQNYPARKYALIMSDHGAGWPGGWSDPDPGGLGPDELVLAELFGDNMWLMEFDGALEEARSQAGIDRFEFIGLDVCLMSQLEVFNVLVPHAYYATASQEVEPGLGWAYTGFLTELVNNPEMEGAELSQRVVEAYIDQDQRVLDDTARQAILQGLGVTADISASDYAASVGNDITLAAVDLAAIPAVNAAVDSLTAALANADPQAVAEARAYARSFESIFGEDVPSPYIDLGHFTQLVAEFTGDSEVAAAVAEVQNALGQAVLAEKHGPEREGATGLTIYFPTSEIYGTADDFGYTAVAERFAGASQWDEYLQAFHGGGESDFSRPGEEAPEVSTEDFGLELTQEEFDTLVADINTLLDAGYLPEEIPQAMVDEFGYEPEFIQALLDAGFFDQLGSSSASRSGAASRSMAAGPKPIELAPLTLSAEVATITAPVTISSEVSGDRLAYLYSFIGRFLPREDVLLIEDIDYIFAEESQTVGGVTYPNWPEGDFTIEYDWEPTVYAVSDGQTSVKALFDPAAYDAESPVYSVNGTYRFASGGAPRFAKMFFRDGLMSEILGFTGSITQALGAPHEITPQPGDQFTVLARGDDLTQEGEAGRESVVREAGTLTFSGQAFTLETTPAPSGNYVVGLIAEDLDGNTYEQYEGLFVVNEQASAVDGFVPYVSEALDFALLYPETWSVTEEAADETVTFSDDNSGTVILVGRDSFPDATTPAEANDLAIQEAIDTIKADGDLENLQFLSEAPEDFVLGAYDGQIVDLSFDFDGTPMAASIIVSTLVPTTTYGVLTLVPEANFDATAAEVDSLLYSFDILLSGLNRVPAGPPPPAFASQLFSDDYSQPTSGLFDDQEVQEWGRGYYAESGQYIYELNPNAGPIYDYYPDQTLPGAFLLQVTTSFSEAVDNAYGLIFQVQAGQEADQFYTFQISGDGFYTIEKVTDEVTPLIDWTGSGLIQQQEGAANILTVEGHGDTYNFYINGQQVNSVTDPSFSDGSFGLVVDNYDEESPATFTFDDLSVGLPVE